jgi:DNA-binding beta-propeller fold protein YncE
MAINTITTPVIEAFSLKNFSASTTVANEALTHWYNDSDPANSLVFAAAGGLISIWRVDLRNPGTSDTVSTRVGFFRQTLDTATGDLFFHYDAATTTGYLYVTGNRGSVWLYSFNPTTVTGGEAVVQVSDQTSVASLNSGSTSLLLSNGSIGFDNFQGLTTGTQFKIAGHAQPYSLSATPSLVALLGQISTATGSFSNPFNVAYVPAPVDRLFVTSFSNNTVSIINPNTNQRDTGAVNTGGTGVISQATGSFANPRSVDYVPAPVDRLFVANFNNSTVSIINPNTNQRDTGAVNTGGTGVISQATGSFSSPSGVAYVPAPVDRLFVANNNSTVSIINPSTNQQDTGAVNTGGTGVISQATGSFSSPSGAAYVPAPVDRLFVSNFNNSTVSIINPNTNQRDTGAVNTGGTGVISQATGSFSSPSGVAYVPAPVDRLFVSNWSGSTVSIINPNTNQRDTAAVNTGGTGVISTAAGSFSNPYGVDYVPAPVDRLFVANFTSSTVSIINPNINRLPSGTFVSASFTPGLESAVNFNTPLIFNGPSFYTARARLASDSNTTQPTLAVNPTAGILAVRNADNIFIYRNITPTSFDGTSNVTVAGTSIPPFTTGGSGVGYYNITSNPITVTATTSQISLYYRANAFSYLLATNNTHQFFLYLINVDTATATITTAKATFSTNALNANSVPRFAAVASLGSGNVALFVAGNALDMLYRFSETLFDGTSTIALNGVSIAHSSGYAVPATAALIRFPHGSTVGQSRAAAIAFNPTTSRTLLFSGSGFNYELPLANFDGTTERTLKGITVLPVNSQYSLASNLSSLAIPTFVSDTKMDLDLVDPSRSVLSALQGTFYLASLNRHTTSLTLLTQRFTGAPAITKSSPTATLTLSSEIDAYQALYILSAGSQFLSLQGSGANPNYSNGEYYPFAFSQTDDAEGTFNEGFTLSGATAAITGNYRLTMASGTTLTLSGKATYSESFTLLSGSTLAIAQNTTLTGDLVLNSGTTVTRAAGATGNYTLTLPYSSGGITAGSGITIQGLAATLAVTSLPVGANVAAYNAAGTLLLSGVADGSGIVSTSYSGGTTTITIRARLAGRIPFEATATLTSSGLTIPVFMPLDTNYTP